MELSPREWGKYTSLMACLHPLSLYPSYADSLHRRVKLLESIVFESVQPRMGYEIIMDECIKLGVNACPGVKGSL